MEIKIEVFNSALKLSKNAPKHSKLEEILIKLDSFSAEDIINNKAGSNFHNEIYSIIATIVARSSAENQSIAIQATNELSEVITLASHYLKNSFSQKNFKYILLFNAINSYLQIPVKFFIRNLEISDADFSQMIDKLKSICDGFYCNIGVPENAPYYEKKWVINFNEGYTENDLEKVYEFVLAVERGGTMGFHFNFTFENLLKFLFDLDPGAFHTCLIKRTKVSDFIFFTQWLSLEELLIFCRQYEFENKWLQFELLRQIIEHEKVIANTRNNLLVLSKLQNSISKIDIHFFCSVILHFNNSIISHSALAMTLTSLDSKAFNTFLERCVLFNISASFIEQKRALLNTYNTNENRTNLSQLLSGVFSKWEVFYLGLYDNQEPYISDIILTDYAYLIIAHYSHQELDFIVAEINHLIFHLKYHSSFWYKNKSLYKATFFLKLSKLNLLSYAYRSICEQKQTQIKIDTLDLFSNAMINTRFFNKLANKDALEQVKLNLSQNN